MPRLIGRRQADNLDEKPAGIFQSASCIHFLVRTMQFGLEYREGALHWYANGWAIDP